ncbi:MAG: hypothetical protein LR015_06985 [Verrucomicrobia bacterium]|nr:hypothetical protein [Verrucomicrobiota bacterium]
MPYDIFIRHVLYAPEMGYYTRPSERVGRKSNTDFYTARSLGRVFRNLVVDACTHLLDEDPGHYHFVEIGAEPAQPLIASGDPHPFASVRTLRVGEPLTLSGPLVVFSNELFDAQPFRRFKVVNGRWRERGVRISTEGISEELLPEGGALPPTACFSPGGLRTGHSYRSHATHASPSLAGVAGTDGGF